MPMMTCDGLRERYGFDGRCCNNCHERGDGMQGIIMNDETPAFVCCAAVTWAQANRVGQLAYFKWDDHKTKEVFPAWKI